MTEENKHNSFSPKSIEEAITAVEKFNQENKYRDGGYINASINMVLKEIKEREKRYWKREERFLDMYNREKEKHEEIYNDLLDERDENYISKQKIKEIYEKYYQCNGKFGGMSSENMFNFIMDIEHLLEEE